MVFAEHGIGVPLELVAERAGVGRGTLYRNFADREVLMAALIDRSVTELEEDAQRYRGRDDALMCLLAGIAERGADNPAFSQCWRAISPQSRDLAAARARFIKVFEEPLAHAVAAGRCRADLQPSDMLLVAGMLGAALRGTTREERRTLAERALCLVMSGIAGGK